MPSAFDPTVLDWSRHLLPASQAEFGDGMFLADLTQRLGYAIFEGWNECAPADMKPDRFPGVEILHADDAFHRNGEPIPEIHAAFGAAVRSIVSPAAWSDINQRITDEKAWLRAHVPDPDGGPPLTRDALAARLGQDSSDPITEENWQFVWEIVELERQFRLDAAEKLTRVASAVAELALSGDLKLHARPEAGGECDTPVPLSIWTSGAESRIRVLASCGFNASEPNDPAAPATHLIFAAEEGLENALASYGAKNHILIPPPTYVDPDRDSSRRSPQQPELEERVFDFLLPLVRGPGRTNWRAEDLRALANLHFGLELRGILRNVRKRLVEEGKLDHLTAPGQPPKAGRPSLMTRSERKALIAASE